MFVARQYWDQTWAAPVHAETACAAAGFAMVALTFVPTGDCKHGDGEEEVSRSSPAGRVHVAAGRSEPVDAGRDLVARLLVLGMVTLTIAAFVWGGLAGAVSCLACAVVLGSVLAAQSPGELNCPVAAAKPGLVNTPVSTS